MSTKQQTGAPEGSVRETGPVPLSKAATGIEGFDAITQGGLPCGRASLVTGAAGSGKTLFGLEFLVRGAVQYGEPGVLLAFEETSAELATNVQSLGFDLPALEREGLLVVDAFHVDAATIVTTGAFDLDGLFIRLAWAIDQIGAKRVVLDSIEVLFSALGNEAIVRSELSRLLRWLKDRGLSVVITGERGRSGELTRFGIEEYVSDCVVVLDHRVTDELSTRRMRIAKYRGSTHGTNEYPFLITDRGIVVLPLSTMGLAYDAPNERMSTGVDRLDHMLGGGVYRGSTTMISGSPGTGKTSLGAAAAAAACDRGERVLFMSFEESPAQLKRNMAAIGIDLEGPTGSGRLRLWSSRPTAMGSEAHLVQLHRLIEETDPTLVVLDAVGSLNHLGTQSEVTAVLARQLDMIKARGITAIMTSLTHDRMGESSTLAVSSLVDTWLLLRNLEQNAERSRLLFVIKSRGMAHSNQVREFVMTDDGIELLDVYVGPQGVLAGSARMAQLAQEDIAAQATTDEAARRRAAFVRHVALVEQQISTLREGLAADEAELATVERVAAAVRTGSHLDREAMAAHRWADAPQSRSAESRP